MFMGLCTFYLSDRRLGFTVLKAQQLSLGMPMEKWDLLPWCCSPHLHISVLYAASDRRKQATEQFI